MSPESTKSGPIFDSVESKILSPTPLASLALPVLSFLEQKIGSPSTTEDILYSCLTCALLAVSIPVFVGVTRTAKRVRSYLRNKELFRYIDNLTASERIATENGYQYSTTVELLYCLYGYDLKKWKQHLADEQNKPNKRINRSQGTAQSFKSRLPSLPDFQSVYEDKYSNIPNLNPELMQQFRNSSFPKNNRDAAEAMVGYTIERIRTTKGEEQAKHINDLHIHNVFMKFVVDRF